SLCDYERLLSSLRDILPLTKKPKTLLEITRFPRSELAHSNILKFFLDPKEEHGLDDVFLKALLEAVGSPLVSSPLGAVEVVREDRTESNKSIDIVVEGEFFVVGIEHKIGAELYNPLKEYKERLIQ